MGGVAPTHSKSSRRICLNNRTSNSYCINREFSQTIIFLNCVCHSVFSSPF
ncbi:hypothetical protein AR9_g143 [Bacillus phage AR9]|uniref:Uncharacterized protein n=1 Tax=Bacillus phage AR9 TaxID=1815509 RepID=A0A172JI50_BPPB1|nr:hypothetical protein BI022_gp142 [Bacillus phage AR9]AMS01227.1 hypothetical protein AR9_g143 [Bacillus phage AR9]